MSRSGELAEQTRGFADHLTKLLNETVCDNAFVGAICRPDGSTAAIGTNLFRVGRAGAVRLSASGDVPLWLTVTCRAYLDDRGHLTVEQSAYFLQTGPNQDRLTELLHYDYERDKAEYPEAHLQVNANSDEWEAVLAASGKPKAGVGKLHLPVGGRRYRPALEDLIDALIREGLLIGKPGWPRIIDEHREKFRKIQLLAAIARSPEVAAVALQGLGYEVSPPSAPSAFGKLLPFKQAKKRGRQGRKG